MLLAFVAASVLQTPETRRDESCDAAVSTVDINRCLTDKLGRAQERLERYTKRAIDRYAREDGKDDEVAFGIRAANTAFEAYRDIECQTVFEDWKDGTIRGAMMLSCQIRLTDERAHTVWNNWLRYLDGRPSILPEPAPSK